LGTKKDEKLGKYCSLEQNFKLLFGLGRGVQLLDFNVDLNEE